MKKTFWLLLVMLLLVISISCNKCNEEKPRVAKVELPKQDTFTIKIHRFEKALFEVDLKDFQNGLKKIKPEFHFFLDGDLNDKANLRQLKDYLTDQYNLKLYDDCVKKYPDLKDIEPTFTKAFRLYKYYFPDKKIPKVYTYVSGLDCNNQIKFADSVLIIALDMYLGADYKFYKNIDQPVYKQKRFRKDFILPDCIHEIAKSMIDNSKENKKFIDYIIYEGKVLYFMDAILPDTPDSLKMYYTPSQMDWCVKNEKNIWSFIIDKKLLYATDPSLISKLFIDGPFTPVFSKQSPPKTGIWIGWQIVRSYMNNNPKISLKELFLNQDAQDILTRSKYKPKK